MSRQERRKENLKLKINKLGKINFKEHTKCFSECLGLDHRSMKSSSYFYYLHLITLQTVNISGLNLLTFLLLSQI